MRMIEANKVEQAIKDYWKAQVDKALTLTDGNEKRINIYLEHNHELLKAIDELPSIHPDTTTHDSISAETGENDGDRTSGDCISRQQATDTLRAMQTYKLFAGDDMLLVDQAEAQTELMMLPPVQPDIIRCKDCKYCEHWYADKGRCFLWHESGIDVFEEGFCNYAERRTDG